MARFHSAAAPGPICCPPDDQDSRVQNHTEICATTPAVGDRPTCRVILKPKRAKPFYARHPWVFAGAIQSLDGDPADGDVVDVVSSALHFVARGFYNSQSKIRVRLFCWDASIPLDNRLLAARIERAVSMRQQLLGLNHPRQGCRLVFSEADGLSGLIVDRYADWLVVQFTALAMAQRRKDVGQILFDLLRPRGIYQRTERGIGELEGITLQDESLLGAVPAGAVEIEEGTLRFRVQITEGQKTGFYFDQSANRRAAARYARGRRVLDAFCYSGGFGLWAAEAGAASVLGVDVSAAALSLARENAALNGQTNVEYVQEDVFDHLDSLAASGARFGMVILDPPRFARARNSLNEALRGYRRLFTLALRVLETEGIFVTCCCSGIVTGGMLEDLLCHVAAAEKRDVQILERRGQAADHPVLTTCPETNYLKCFICRVLD